MGFLFTQFISDEIVQDQFRKKYGKKYGLKLEMQYQFEYNRTKIDIGFTADAKAFWIFKYKGEYYMNIMEEIEEKDKYTLTDVFTTLLQNAIDSYRFQAGLTKMKKQHGTTK